MLERNPGPPVRRECFRPGPGRSVPGDAARPADDPRPADLEEFSIRCRHCGSGVTSSEHGLEVDGRKQHTFFNPAGLLFEIGSFSAAPGCANMGRPTTEFCWFPGFAWRYAHCAACGTHLGWQFVSEADAFWGLVLERLIEAGA